MLYIKRLSESGSFAYDQGGVPVLKSQAYPASAEILSPDQVRVSSPVASRPGTVRCAWYSFGPAGLFGGTGLAAAPFEWSLQS